MNTCPPTWKQARRQVIEQLRAETGCTVDEAADCADFRLPEWKESTEDYARRGGVFPARWLNACDEMWRYMLAKHHPESIPVGYVNPQHRNRKEINGIFG